MQIQSAYSHENAFNLKMDEILQESRRELQERAHLISLEIDSHAATAKKDVQTYLNNFTKTYSIKKLH